MGFGRSRHHKPLELVIAVLTLISPGAAPGDTFTYLNKDRNSVQVEAELYGSGQGVHALRLADGQIQIIPQAAVQNRKVAAGPEPLTPEAALKQLENKFGKVTFRGLAEPPYVIGLILAAPLPKSSERRASAALKKAAHFMKSVERVFKEFVKRIRVDTKPPTHPLVLLIFETDDIFNKYNKEVTGGQGLSARNTSGFYSPLSNWLAIRMTECLTFETPLHEAIHQQVYNQHVLKRLAPLPTWFNEGIATGFEGNGEKISIGPSRISRRYSYKAQQPMTLDWKTIVADDSAFRGDVLAGEAYTHAWSLHWLLVSKYRDKYVAYLKLLSQKEPLQVENSKQRVREFEEILGKSVSEFQSEFFMYLRAGLKRQKLPVARKKQPGKLTVQSNLAEISIIGGGGRDIGLFQASGKLKNISTIRAMSFHAVVSTNAGTYCEWFVPNLKINKTVLLKRKFARMLMRNAPDGVSSSFRIHVSSATPDSDEAARWNRGVFPVPVYTRR